MTLENLVQVEVRDDDFLKVVETLTRIGVASEKSKRLYQSCHILHKRGKFYLMHFKELFALDGKPSTMDEQDLARRNTIANLLHDWGLLKLVDAAKSAAPVAPMRYIKVVPFKDKKDWDLVAKYQIGQVKGNK